MVSTATFQVKNYAKLEGWSDQEISFCSGSSMCVSIIIKGNDCTIKIEGVSEQDNLDCILLIWELLAWTDGYFFKPIRYFVDDIEKPLSAFKRVKYTVTDTKWISSTVLLCRNQRQINEKTLENYKNIRFLDRNAGSMNVAMFPAFFYLISKSYARINIEHRLVLLMHICDGFAREYCNGSDRNNSGNIHKILAKIKKSKYTEGAVLLGMPSNMALDALCQTRNELTHYIPKAGSIGSFIDDSDIKTDGMVNLYVFYVLETALRVAVLEQVDFHISEEIKEYIMDAYLDWIRLENDLDEECVIPGNRLRQIIKKIQSENRQP